ncbi:hypothetical protein H7U19_15780 [Hyunsoonleella sp. SJ7]|uniref:Uncharacterized protein n=1 Tax=Hyunsoonleella aquatilis TaxID=2762758 RepID=A0A923HKB3_9FLAO|nr:hypothetical protein [Hyunsoonleella aquatilis]MBC3759872.1 hypothetical protein [Hyunsoonleella aquatilis]
MKTRHLNFVCILLLFLLSNSMFSQENNMFKLIADATEHTFEIVPTALEIAEDAPEALMGISDDFRESYALEPHDPDGAYVLAATMIAIGAGIGFGDNQFGVNQFLYCLHAAYFIRLATMGKSFLYGAVGLALLGTSTDNLTRTLLEPSLRVLMFSPLTMFSQVYLFYGLMFAYAFGTEDFDNGFKYDITLLTAALVVGFAIILSSTLTLKIQTHLVSHTRQTQEPDGGGAKSEINRTWGTIMQNNLLLFALLINL